MMNVDAILYLIYLFIYIINNYDADNGLHNVVSEYFFQTLSALSFFGNDQIIETHFMQRNRKQLKSWFYHRQEPQHGGHLTALLDDALGDAGDGVFETEPEPMRMVRRLLGPDIRLKIARARDKQVP
ncbi:MAG: hypothetical protein MZU91_08695 [Desulfosudis oleivorans]|nr:hypothetical protein [Desulfosudis oleivorans]